MSRHAHARSLALVAMLAASAGVLGCGGASATRAPGAADAPAEAPPDLARPVVTIAVEGMPADRSAAARRLIGTKVGAPIDRVQLRRDARLIFALGGIADLRVRARAAEGGVLLTYEVEERPRVRAITLSGVTEAGGFDPRAAFGVKQGDAFDPVAMNRGRAALGQAYRDHGFVAADVTWTVAPPSGGTVDVAIAVHEGTVTRVGAVGFRGNAAVKSAELAELLGKAGAVAGQPYVRDRVRLALAHVQEAYFDRGHIESRIGPVEETFSADKTTVDLVLPVVEGPGFRLGKLTVTGALAAPAKAYLAAFGLRRGAVFSKKAVTEGLARIDQLHKDKGQPALRVEPTPTVDDKRKVVDLTLTVAAP